MYFNVEKFKGEDNKYYFVYKTTCLINNKIYIGKRVCLENTLAPTYLGSGTSITNAIKKYGTENFTREILEFCHNNEELCEREKYWISIFRSTDRKVGYNLTIGGDGLLNPSPEVRLKMRKAKLGTHPHLSEEVIQKKREISSRVHKGKKLSDETKKKLSIINKGRWSGDNNPMRNPEIKERVSKSLRERYSMMPNSMQGKRHSIETRKKISEAQKGRKAPQFKCPICGRMIGGIGNYNRHYNLCLEK